MTTAPAPDAYTSSDYFEREMRALRATSWQFVAVTDDLANNNDWIRRRLFGLDIFVQNFHGELRGYHNVCQHRGFPIRRAPRGNGTVQCGFHGWTYNRHGVPTGIPRNDELFQLSREDQASLALPSIRVETVGKFVFAAIDPEVPALDAYLGRYVDVLAAISRRMRAIRHRWSGAASANWKLCFEITLDDYHAPFVHAATIGAPGPVAAARFFYGRERAHSYLFLRRDPDWMFTDYWTDIAAKNYDFTGYKIHQLFPNLLISTRPTLVLVSLYQPVGPSRTEVDDVLFEVDGNPDDPEALDAAIATVRATNDEDRTATEAHQEVIGQFARAPTLGRVEERIGWFYDEYERIVGARARDNAAR